MKTVIVLSGGMDSATLLYHLRNEGHTLRALTVNYGQRHEREIVSAVEICREAGVEHRVADLRAINPFFGENSLSGRSVDVPEGHYNDESMRATIVPNRNMILLAVAIAWAVGLKYEAVAYGAHAGDHTIYPDCRPEFAAAMARAAALCDWQPIELLRPFIHMDKGDIARRGVELGAPLHLTWTCYQGGAVHCGRCGACRERIEAFGKYGLTDPAQYAERP